MLTLFYKVFGTLVAVKGIDIIVRGADHIPVPLLVAMVFGWFASAIGIASRRYVRTALFITIMLSATTMLFGIYNHHMYLIASVCVILFIDRQVPMLLRFQVTVVYTFGTIAKINETFLAGSVLYVDVVQRPVWQALLPDLSMEFLIALSATTIVLEGFLAFGLWLRSTRWIALVVGVGLHVFMIVFMTFNLHLFIQLLVFGGVMMSLYMPFFQDKFDDQVVSRHRVTQAVQPRTATGNINGN